MHHLPKEGPLTMTSAKQVTPTREEDARIGKTKAALACALEQLAFEKDFSDITICEICTRAHISRAAFYAHFRDKFDLMRFAVISEAGKLAEESEQTSFRSLLVRAFEHLRSNDFIARRITMGKFDSETAIAMEEAFAEIIRSRVKSEQWRCRHMGMPVEACIAYCAHGIAGIAMWWVRSDFRLSGAQVANMACTLASATFAIDD